MPPAPSYDQFDCYTGYHDWSNLWGDLHQKYCCTHYGRACPLHDVPPKVIYHHVPVYMQPHTSVVPVPIPAPAHTHVVYQTHYVQPHVHHFKYNCHAGFSNWYFGWSHHKKAWCCSHAGRGCPGTWHGSYHLHMHVEHGVGHAHGRIYDCDAGFSNWMQGWSDSKKDWCCSHEHRGCVKYHCTGHVPWAAMQHGDEACGACGACGACDVSLVSFRCLSLRLWTGTPPRKTGAPAFWWPHGPSQPRRA